MNFQDYVVFALQRARMPLHILQECISVLLMWCSIPIMKMLLTGPNPLVGADTAALILTVAVWVAIVGTGFAILAAALKSSLPALVALFLVVPFALLGHMSAAYIALAIATAATVINIIAFVAFGSRLPSDA